jgi:hypothetical protein
MALLSLSSSIFVKFWLLITQLPLGEAQFLTSPELVLAFYTFPTFIMDYLVVK